MLVIVGLNVLLFAGVIAFVGVLSNAGVAHPLCGCVAVCALHEQCEHAAQLVQLLISGTTCRPKLLASDAFSTTPPPAR
jgi:hypothetical protein